MADSVFYDLAETPEEAANLTARAKLMIAIEQATNYSTLFITEEGHIGLGPTTMKPGDGICVVLGCSVPLVLRSQDVLQGHRQGAGCTTRGSFRGSKRANSRPAPSSGPTPTAFRLI